jgi:hypothetical protein
VPSGELVTTLLPEETWTPNKGLLVEPSITFPFITPRVRWPNPVKDAIAKMMKRKQYTGFALKRFFIESNIIMINLYLNTGNIGVQELFPAIASKLGV